MDVTAENFLVEAQVSPSSVGFLWGINYDILSDKLRNHPNSGEGSSSQATQNAGKAATQNAGNAPHDVHPVVLTSDVNYMLQNNRAAMLMPPPSNLPQTFSPTIMPWIDMTYLVPRTPQWNITPPGFWTEIAGLSYPLDPVGPRMMLRPDMGNMLQSAPSTIMQTPDLNYMQQSTSLTMMLTPGLPNLQQTDSPPMMPMPAFPDMLQTAIRTIMPTTGLPDLQQTTSPTMMPMPGLPDLQQTTSRTMMPTPGLPDMLQIDITPMMPTPGLPDLLQTDSPTMTPMPGLPDLQQIDSPPMMSLPGLPDMPQTASPTILSSSDIATLQQSAPSTITPSPDLKPDRFGPIPSPNFDMMQGQTITDLIAARMREQESLRLPVSRLFNVNQLTHMLPSSRNPSLPQKKVHKKRLEKTLFLGSHLEQAKDCIFMLGLYFAAILDWVFSFGEPCLIFHILFLLLISSTIFLLLSRSAADDDEMMLENLFLIDEMIASESKHIEDISKNTN